MCARSAVMLLLIGACASAGHMARRDEASYTATLASAPPWAGSPVRITVSPMVTYSRSTEWNDVGHSYRVSRIEEESEGITLEILNQTDKDLQIDWERSSFVDNTGHSRRIIHSGIDPVNRDAPQTPTEIPAHATVSETIYPADTLMLERGDWHHRIFLPTQGSDSAVQLSLTLGLVSEGALVTIPQPILARITAKNTTSKSGDKWPRLGAPCEPIFGCATGLVCTSTSSDFRCLLAPP